MNDIIINKTQKLQRCVERAREEMSAAGASFRSDFSRQDAAILNVMRACELAVDLANHVIKTGKMGVPSSSGESFELLAGKGVIPPSLEKKMKAMIGFRNIAVHEYQNIDLNIVETVIKSGLDDLIEFTGHIVTYSKKTK